MIKNIIKKIEKTEEVLCVIMLMLMCTFIFLGTLARFTGLFVITWAEEFARYCMIWSVFLGIGVAAVRGQHFMVNAIGLFCPPSIVKASQVICAVLVAAFALVCVIYGIDVLAWQMNANQITATLHWPMWLMYLSIPLGLGLMAVCYCYHIYELLSGQADPTQEGGM